MKNFVDKYKNAIFILLSLFTTIALNLKIHPDYTTFIFDGNNLMLIVYFLFTYVLLNKVNKIDNKRLKICSIVLSIIISIIMIIGFNMNSFFTFNDIDLSKFFILCNIIKLLGYIVIFYIFISLLFNIFDNFKIKNKEFSFFTNNKKSLIICFLIILLAYIPYFLTYYPGVLSPDSVGQVEMSLGLIPLTNHHPLFHTLLIGIVMNLGKIMNNYTLAVALFSLLQMCFMAFTFSYSLYYMAKKKVDVRIRIVSLIFFALYPIHALYSLTMWKDIPFAIVMLLLTINLSNLYYDKEKYLNSKFNIFILIINLIAVMLFRNNGLYVVLLLLPCLLLFFKKEYKKILIISFSVLFFYALWKGVVFKLLNVSEGSSREAFSIPLQQFARIKNFKYYDLTEEEKEKIDNFFTVDNIEDYYYPIISDQVKNNFDEKYFKDNKLKILTTYLEFAFKYPRVTMESFFAGSYGYYYPEAIHWVVGREIYDASESEWKNLNIKTDPIIEISLVKKIDNLIDRRDLPFISMTFSIGFAFISLITMLMYNIYKKNYYIIIIYLPILFLWLTCLASPVFGEFRYIYSLFTCLPLIISLNFRKSK